MRILLGIVWATLFSVSAAAQIELSVPNLKAPAGSSIVVPIVISSGKDIAAVQFDLQYDASQLSIPNEESVLYGDALTDHSPAVQRTPRGLRVVLFSASLSGMKDGMASVINVILRTSAGAAAGSSNALELTNLQASDLEGNQVSVTARNGSLTITSQPTEVVSVANRLVFGQVVNGTYPGGSYVTTLIFVNRTGLPTAGQVRFYKSDGAAMDVRMTDGQSGSVFSFQAPERGIVLLETDGSGPLAVGYAQLMANGPLGGTVLFSQRDAAGQPVSESGVGGSQRQAHFSVPLIFVRGQADTGIGLANQSAAAVSVSLALRDQAGAVVATRIVPLAPREHKAQFASEHFSLLATMPEFNGSIEVLSSSPIGAIALKLQGTLLTTFPVVEIR